MTSDAVFHAVNTLDLFVASGGEVNAPPTLTLQRQEKRLNTAACMFSLTYWKVEGLWDFLSNATERNRNLNEAAMYALL